MDDPETSMIIFDPVFCTQNGMSFIWNYFKLKLRTLFNLEIRGQSTDKMY